MAELQEMADMGSSISSSWPRGGDATLGKLPGMPSVGDSRFGASLAGGCSAGRLVVIFRGASGILLSAGVASSGGRMASLVGDGPALLAAAAAAAAAVARVAASASS